MNAIDPLLRLPCQHDIIPIQNWCAVKGILGMPRFMNMQPKQAPSPHPSSSPTPPSLSPNAPHLLFPLPHPLPLPPPPSYSLLLSPFSLPRPQSPANTCLNPRTRDHRLPRVAWGWKQVSRRRYTLGKNLDAKEWQSTRWAECRARKGRLE